MNLKAVPLNLKKGHLLEDVVEPEGKQFQRWLFS
jgi:hypothetical protein